MASKREKAGGVEERTALSVVIPILNEAGTLRELYERLKKVLKKMKRPSEIIFVDDGSTDGSGKILEELCSKDPSCRAVVFRRNFGKAAAYTAGFNHSRGEVVATMDGDLQDDPAEIPALVGKLGEGYDLVTGWKYEGKGPVSKALPSRLFNKVTSFFTGLPIHDFNCPLKAYRGEILRDLDIHGELHRFIPALAHAKGFRVAEVKVKNYPRKYGKSKYGAKRFLKGFLDLLTVLFVTRFIKRPLHLFGAGGFVIGFIGFAILFFLLFMHFLRLSFEMGWIATYVSKSWDLHNRPLLMLGVLMLIIGIQFISMGLMAEMLAGRRDPDRESDQYIIRETRN